MVRYAVCARDLNTPHSNRLVIHLASIHTLPFNQYVIVCARIKFVLCYISLLHTCHNAKGLHDTRITNFYPHPGARCSSVVERPLMVRWVVGSIPHDEPTEVFLAACSDWRNRDRDICYRVCGMTPGLENSTFRRPGTTFFFSFGQANIFKRLVRRTTMIFCPSDSIYLKANALLGTGLTVIQSQPS